MKLFLLYLRERRNQLLLLLIFVVILVVSFSTYNLPFIAILYPFSLCLLLGIMFIVWDFLKVKGKYKALLAFESDAALLERELPKVKGPYEEEYQRLIKLLREKIVEMEYENAAKYDNLVDYYSMWVHQIKTPIASMDLTLQNQDSPLARKCSADLFRIEQYVSMVLAYLRLDSKSSDYNFKRVDLDQIIKESIKGFKTEFIANKIGLRFIPTDYHPVSDSKWLGFVIDQILSNSLKYTNSGFISIAMEGEDILSIQDTGIGIKAEDLPRVFENGFTGYNGRSFKKSTGIGLYLCSRICQNLGINISISSNVGKGTTVLLDFSKANVTIM